MSEFPSAANQWRNPWDIIIPIKGDDGRPTTAAAKGEAISQWEYTEEALSFLCSVLRPSPPKYGEPLNFKDRLSLLETYGHEHFQRMPNQVLEGDFEDVIQLARMLSQRRNEIVHSGIRGVEYDRRINVETGGITVYCKFFIVPPSYTAKKWDQFHQPTFIYSSEEIEAYSNHFMHIQAAASNLGCRIRGEPLPPFGRRHPEQETSPCMAARQSLP